MGIHSTIPAGTMTVEQFYAFTDAKPDHEKWELIGGTPILNAAPTDYHNTIVASVTALLWLTKREAKAAWQVLAGGGVLVSEKDRPQPDVQVVAGKPTGSRARTDVIVAFEVLSPTTEHIDLNDKRIGYTSLATLTHYVVIAQDKVEVKVFARENGFDELPLKSLNDVLELRSLDARLPLSEIYQDTGLDG